MDAPRWDLFCRVIDNHGDIGVCWRLAADLASRGVAVRLWVDDASALQWMAPLGAEGVTVLAWPSGGADAEANVVGDMTPGDVVIEAFGCELPAGFLHRMAAMPCPPTWINLEYLSAEPFVERVHRLPSPQPAGPGAGLRKWFFYPGFTDRTGGLIREPDLATRQRTFDAASWLHAEGIRPVDGERRVSLFCYAQPMLPALLDQLAQQPTLLLATHGLAAQQVSQCLGSSLQRGSLRAQLLPPLTQRDYDHLLWACDLNFVRGEDSFVRAQWSGKPFVWQIYPQDDGAHAAKLGAFLMRFLAGADPALAASVAEVWRSWNATNGDFPVLPFGAGWSNGCAAWRTELMVQADLTSQLLGFAAGSR